MPTPDTKDRCVCTRCDGRGYVALRPSYRETLACLRARGRATSLDLRRDLPDVSHPAIDMRLLAMERVGLIRRVAGRRAHPIVWEAIKAAS